MTERIWKIKNQGQEHTIRFFHNPFIDQRKIWLDDVLIVEKSTPTDDGTFNRFYIDNTEFTLDVSYKSNNYRYTLCSNDKTVKALPRKHDESNELDSFISLVNTFWHRLSELSGLTDYTIPNANLISRNRLIGQYQDFLIGVQHCVSSSEPISPFLGLKIKYDNLTPQDEKIKAIRNDLVHLDGIGKDNPLLPHLLITKNYALIPLQINETYGDADEIHQKIAQIIEIFARYTEPISSTQCENEKCQNQSSEDVNLIFCNGVPQYLCQNCVIHYPDHLKKNINEIIQKPFPLKDIFLLGIKTVLIGGSVLAGLQLIFSNYLLIIVLSAVTLPLISPKFDQLIEKPTLWKIPFLLLTISYEFAFGMMLTFLFALLWQPENLNFIRIWFDILWQFYSDTETFIDTIKVIVFFAVIFPLLDYSYHKRNYFRRMKLDIEIIEQEKFSSWKDSKSS